MITDCLHIKLATVVKGNPKAPFSIVTTPTCRGGRYSFPLIAHFTLDTYLIMLSVKRGVIKYHFLSLWYDSTWDWTQVSLAIGEHSNHHGNVRYTYCLHICGFKYFKLLYGFNKLKIIILWKQLALQVTILKKQKVPRKNNYRRRLRRWHSDTGKYTQPSRNTTA